MKCCHKDTFGQAVLPGKKDDGTGPKVMAAGIFMVFLILAALISQKWSLPFSILMAVTFLCPYFRSFVSCLAARDDNYVYFFNWA